MSAIVLDTSSWIPRLHRPRDERLDASVAAGRVYLPVVVAGELTGGNLAPRPRADLEAFLERLRLHGTDLPHWTRAGSLRASLRARGLSVSTLDAHVAQSALDLDAELVTEDAIFAHMAKHVPLRLARA